MSMDSTQRGKPVAMLRRLRSNEDEESPANDGAANAPNNDNDDEALQRLLARIRTEHSTSSPDVHRARYLLEATAGNVGLASWLYREESAFGAAGDHEDDARSGAASPQRDEEGSDRTLEAPSAPIPGRRRLLPHEFMDVEGFLREIGRVAGANNNNGLEEARLPGVPPVAAAAAGGGFQGLGGLMNAPSRLNNPPPLPFAPAAQISPRIAELLSRLNRGIPLNEEERRELLGLGNNVNFESLNAAWMAIDAAAAVAARGGNADAPAADGHGQDDDEDDSSEEEEEEAPDAEEHPEEHHLHNNNVPFDWNEPFANMGMLEAAPVRRSGRLRAQRNGRRSRRDHDVAGGILARVPAARRPAEDRHPDGGAVSEDDGDMFVPGPEPVFREIAANQVGIDARSRKRKKEFGLDIKAKYLHGGDDNDEDTSSVISNTSSVELDDFFNPIDESVKPFDFLWATTTGGDNGENDEDGKTCIPQSWLRTGFSLSECGNGLAMALPSDEEWEVERRSYPQVLREGPLKFIKGLFPYHCKGVSALLSIVTAMLYSGASIRGDTVTCDADWTPFDELTLEQRKKEFPKRLIEALSALIFLSAKSMSIRCANALAKMDKQHARKRKKHSLSQEDEDEFTHYRLKMVRRVHQCRVCSWEPDTANNDAPMLPRGRDNKDILVHSSLTNIGDIKAYVRSHLRSYTEPGGCALFLETIARCNGTTYLQKMVPSNTTNDKPLELTKGSLLECKCKETLQHIERKRKDKNISVSMSDEHDCVGVELLSLLLTGQAHSNFESWCADTIGIGLLKIDKHGNIGPRLLRPVKPIWICLGDFGYSTLLLDKKEFIGNVTSLDEPGRAFTLVHWDCWKGKRTTMKVIPSIYDCSSKHHCIPPVIREVEEEPKRTVTQSIAIKILEEQKRDNADLWRNNNNKYGASPKQLTKPITDEELASIAFHPEDEMFYPQEFRRWRYKIINRDDWVSFFRLNGRQKLIVEMKLAPRICVLVRSRWPLATVRDFMPDGKVPFV